MHSIAFRERELWDYETMRLWLWLWLWWRLWWCSWQYLLLLCLSARTQTAAQCQPPVTWLELTAQHSTQIAIFAPTKLTASAAAAKIISIIFSFYSLTQSARTRNSLDRYWQLHFLILARKRIERSEKKKLRFVNESTKMCVFFSLCLYFCVRCNEIDEWMRLT